MEIARELSGLVESCLGGRLVDRALTAAGPVVVVAGADYVDALRCDLDELAHMAGDRVSILSTSCRHPLALRYSAEISGALKCTLGVLNARLLAALAEEADVHCFQRDAMQRWVEKNLGHGRRVRLTRAGVSDAEVLRRIAEMRSAEPRCLAPARCVVCAQTTLPVHRSGSRCYGVRRSKALVADAEVTEEMLAQAEWLWMLSWFSTSTQNDGIRRPPRELAATARTTSSTKAGWSYACIVTWRSSMRLSSE